MQISDLKLSISDLKFSNSSSDMKKSFKSENDLMYEMKNFRSCTENSLGAGLALAVLISWIKLNTFKLTVFVATIALQQFCDLGRKKRELLY